MKYLGEEETRQHNKNHRGYKVFNFRLSEFELDTIAFLIDLYKQPINKTCSEAGRDLQIRLRGLRKGIRQAQEDMKGKE